jgi:hypothetical protein
MRFLYVTGLIVLLAIVAVLVHVQLGVPTSPRVGGCDPNDMVGSQSLELLQLSTWLLWRALLGAALLGAITYALFYFQVFHQLNIPAAWLGRVAVVGTLAVSVGLLVKWLAEGWVANSSGTCLSEAIQTAPRGIATIGRVVPVSWPWAVFVDGMTLALLGAAFGVFVYAVARRARA